MKISFLILYVLIFSILSGCSNNLTKDVYQHTKYGVGENTQTAFIALSNITLDESTLEKIIDDYSKEKNKTRKFLYEYLLAKRTQENSYASEFIKNSRLNSALFLKNNTNWISIGSPFLEQLSMYSITNDDALLILMELVIESDGSNQSVIASDLRVAYEINPDRFLMVAKEMNYEVKKILLLMEDE